MFEFLQASNESQLKKNIKVLQSEKSQLTEKITDIEMEKENLVTENERSKAEFEKSMTQNLKATETDKIRSIDLEKKLVMKIEECDALSIGKKNALAKVLQLESDLTKQATKSKQDENTKIKRITGELQVLYHLQ